MSRLVTTEHSRVLVIDIEENKFQFKTLEQASLLADFKALNIGGDLSPRLLASFDRDDFVESKWWQFLINSIKELHPNTKLNVKSVYCSAIAFGDRPSHKSVTLNENLALCALFLNEDWDHNFGGYFMLKENDESKHVIFPKRSRCVVFGGGSTFIETKPTRLSKKLLRVLYVEVEIH